MSLINQMLRDLEGRKREEAGKPAEVSVVVPPRRRSSSVLSWLIVVAGLLIAAGIGLWFGQRLPAGGNAASGPAPTKAPVRAGTRADAEPGNRAVAVTPDAPTVTAPATVKAQPVRAPEPALVAIQLLHEGGRDGLDLRLSAPAKSDFFALQDPPRWVLDIEGVSDVPANLASAALPAGISKLRYSVADGRLRLVFTAAEAIPADKQVVSATQMKLWFGKAPPAPTVVAKTHAQAPPAAVVPEKHSTGAADTTEMVKVPRRPSPREQAEQDYQDAVGAARAGELGTAAQALDHALSSDAAYAPARQLLAQIYLHQGRKSDAVTLLKQGLARGGSDADRARLSDLYARILADDGKLDQAISLLQAAQPAMAQAPDHYALLAALDQRAGDYQAAATIYNSLVELQPDSGVWWMGLGISLEHLGKPRDAVMAYRRAASAGSLEPAVQKFVDGRIAALSQ